MPIFRSGDADLHYETWGSGPPVLLIHGLGSCLQDWEHQLEALRAYRVIAFDLRGHGRSTRGPGPYRIRQFADDAAALLAHLGVESAHVVGLSLGGGVAFQLALDHPACVRSMTIVNSGPHAVQTTFAEHFAIQSRFLILRLFGLPQLGRVVSGKLFPLAEQAPLRKTFEERFAGNDKASYRAALRALIGWSVQDRLREIACPTLILTADQDYTPVSWKESYVRLIGDARLVVIPDTHHALPMEAPGPFNAALVAFLDGCEAARR
ncbi:MAG TPA: alpha/beta hydrolase [Nevskiaceae bacterium]|nr:alpha/beta hydrolase [Nevskiaceae bacterium]